MPLAQSADVQRGKALLANHCLACHDTSMYLREQRKVKSVQGLRDWIAYWQRELKLEWTQQEIEDVTFYLNDAYYHFSIQHSPG